MARKEADKIGVDDAVTSTIGNGWPVSMVSFSELVEDNGAPAYVAQITNSSRGPEVSSWRDHIFRRTLLAADLVAAAYALVLTVDLSPESFQLTWSSMTGIPLLLIGAKLIGLYDRDEALIRKTTLEEAPKLFHLATLCTLVALLVDGLVAGGTMKFGGALVLWLAMTTFMIAARTAARALALRRVPIERCLFIGNPASAKSIHSKLSEGGGIKAAVVAQLDLREPNPWSTDTSERQLEEIGRLVRELDVHRAIVAPLSADGEEMLDVVRMLKTIGVRVSVLSRLLEVIGSSVEFDDLHGITAMGIKGFDLSRSSAAIKRAFDLIGASIGLLAVAPLMLVIAVAIKLDSPGPVFFGQLRVGRHGERFRVFKFRTMIPNADALKDSLRDRNEVQGGMFKIAEDPRVTRVGKWLRRSSLDELPQFWNVIRGEMSLVGPRPLVIDEDDQIEGWHRRRLELMPGITGHWQILGSTRVPLREMVAIDYLYVANWSLWTDIRILLRTIPHMLARRGL